MQVKLSPRLATIAKYVPEGLVVADIGTDHGYLPVHLLTQNISPKVIASDVNEKPLKSANELVQMLNLTKKIDVRLGDGLTILQPDEPEVVIIAGMGGTTIVSILEQSQDVASCVKRFILQPMQGAQGVREWLVSNGYLILEEELVEDDGIIYEIIVAEHGEEKYSREEILIGPKLLKNRPLLLKKILQQKYQHLESIINEMSKSTSEKTLIKRNEYQQRIEILHKVMTWL